MSSWLSESPGGETAKRFGAYYTDLEVARFLVRWAIRSPKDRVLDPSFGGGVFLYAAAQHLEALGGNGQAQVFGVELNPTTHAQTRTALGSLCSPANLVLGDFFDMEAPGFGGFEAIVGNPPFIRYQQFAGAARAKAWARAVAEGVTLSRLASSWAPFLIHAVGLLKPGGRLGMVLPMELSHAGYARAVLEHLSTRFQQVTLLTFRKRLFSNLSQDTLLLLAEHKGAFRANFRLLDLEGAESLLGLELTKANFQPLGFKNPGGERFAGHWISPKARELYRGLRESSKTVALGELADISIGYVTGNNRYFHLSPQDVHRWGIPLAFLKPAIRRGRALTGLCLTPQDWQALLEQGEAGYLLHIPPGQPLPQEVLRYLQKGQAEGVSQTYKCRVREPWYAVPQVGIPDAFLSYMSGRLPRLVANRAQAVAPNSLHVLRLHPQTRLGSEAMAGLWQTSLTRLSAELEGHALGGGMLKIEPAEARRILVARPNLPSEQLGALAGELDALLRRGETETAQSLADQTLLGQGLGLSLREQALLKEAAHTLQRRRGSR
ncbi:MAG: SAM-dependent methyltransferase [Thermaceae bacterium]|nr:SAM-dependent methyltransferase [Thermaceae bacterium]